MPRVPGGKILTAQPSISTPAAKPVFSGYNPAMGEAGQRMAQAMADVGDVILKIGEKEDAILSQDAVNGFHQRSREYTMGVMAKMGATAIGSTRQATADIMADYNATLESLPNDRTREVFKRSAFAAKESFLSSVASHELTQLEKYRTDTLNAAYASAAEDIKLSTGDAAVVQDIIAKFDQQVQDLYPDQDVSTMRQNSRALLEKAGREAQNRYAQTAAFDLVRAKFTKPGKGGLPEMDYASAKNYLLDNPDKLPQITALTIEQREGLANIIWSDGIRATQQKKEAQTALASTVWTSYNKLLRGEVMDPDEPQSFQEWHRRAEQYTMSGQLDDSVLKTAISYTKAEQLQQRQAESALEVQGRQEKAAERQQQADIRARERFARETNPLMQSNLEILARFNSRIATDPASVPVSEVIGSIGKGLSIDDAIKLSDKIKGAPGKMWNSITGQSVRKILNDYWKNSSFNTDTVRNNAAYNDSMTYFQGWLEKNPAATPEDADKEVRRIMYPYLRGWFKQKYDAIMNNDPILSKE